MMRTNLNDFFIEALLLEADLQRVDVQTSPIEWIQKKLAWLTYIDQGTRSDNLTLEEKAIIDKRYKAGHKNFDCRATADLKAMLKMPVVRNAGGWICMDVFGEQAGKDAFLIVQHADTDLKFQQKILGLVPPFLARGQIRPNDYAYLYDRVQVSLHKAQRFGSQGLCDTAGIWRPFTCTNQSNQIATVEEVDLTAIEFGMKFKWGKPWTLTEYFSHMNKGKVASFAFLPADRHPAPF